MQNEPLSLFSRRPLIMARARIFHPKISRGSQCKYLKYLLGDLSNLGCLSDNKAARHRALPINRAVAAEIYQRLHLTLGSLAI